MESDADAPQPPRTASQKRPAAGKQSAAKKSNGRKATGSRGATTKKSGAAAKSSPKPATKTPTKKKPPAKAPKAAELSNEVSVEPSVSAPEPSAESGPTFRLSYTPISRPNLGKHTERRKAPRGPGSATSSAVAEPATDRAEADAVAPEVVEPEVEVAVAETAEAVVKHDKPKVVEPAEPAAEQEQEQEQEEAPEPEAELTASPGWSPATKRVDQAHSKALASDVALSVRNLTKRFGTKLAVDSVDIEIRAGSFYGFVGPNGAGKTTTLSMVTGLLRPDSGLVRVYGADVWRNAAVAKRMLGVLPDRLRLFDRLTGAEYLHHAAGLRGLDRKTATRRIADLVHAFGLEHSLHRFVSDYSAGMVKKISIAAAMIHSPRLLVLDEPFESVDPVSAQLVIDILTKFTAAGGTVLMSSHSMQLIERVCDSVAIIADGRMLATGTLEEVLDGRSLEDRFVELAGGATAVEGMEWLHSYSD